MPELAEVEFYRKRWDPGLDHRVEHVLLHSHAAVFRGSDPSLLTQHLPGEKLLSSATAAKQMLFRFTGDAWLGVHLGMTGELTVQPADFKPHGSDHFVLVQKKHALVFSDYRMFGRIQFHTGPEAPAWWTSIAPAVLSDEFTAAAVSTFLRRRTRTAIKSVLLMQERFPGVGNWMADEILWRATLHPKRPAGSLNEAEIKTLVRECRWVAKHALALIGSATGAETPSPPDTWLFPHRWEDGGRCPKTKAPLKREEIGGRMTCWSPALQKL